MPTPFKLYSFDEAFKLAQEKAKSKVCRNKTRLLLGNGFSQAYHGDFSYSALYESIKDIKKNQKIKKLFDHFGTSNFEAVLSALKHGQFLLKTYGLKNEDIRKDYETIKDALADAIVKVHPEKTNVIPEVSKVSCHSFLNKFDDIYTVNYDLLLYWTILTTPTFEFSDYFNKDDDTPPDYCEYFEDGGLKKKHVFYLHGAVHLFLKEGRTLKKVWGNKMPLIKQVKQEMENGFYPWVVAEGDSPSKLQQIRSNPYLDHAFAKFAKIEGQLFTFGLSFSEQDEHIVSSIVKNCAIRYLWVGLRGDLKEKKNERLLGVVNRMIKERKEIIGTMNTATKGPLEINFFDTSKMDIWSLKRPARKI